MNCHFSDSAKEIAAKMDALNLWETMYSCNFAVKPKGTVFPYFCTTLPGERPPVKVRFLMLEGWQTMHDFVRARIDPNAGIYSQPIEYPHFEMVLLKTGEVSILRHDTGFMPREIDSTATPLAAKILWEAYGIMLRLESDRALPLKFADEQSVFARVERNEGEWNDAPLEIPEARPYSESILLPKKVVRAAKDLPLAVNWKVNLDFRLQPFVMTREARPRCVYQLLAVDGETGEKVFDRQASVHPEIGLKGLWESMPAQVLENFVDVGRVPGEIRLRSGRVFRFLRPLCMELPIKLSLHDNLPNLGFPNQPPQPA